MTSTVRAHTCKHVLVQETNEVEEGAALANRRNWRRTSLMIPVKMLEDLDAAAADQGLNSRADLIRIACHSYMRNKINEPELPPTITSESVATRMRTRY